MNTNVNPLCRSISLFFACLTLVAITRCGAQHELQAKPIKPLDGCAWIEKDGIRAAWLSYKQLDDAMVVHLRNARVNTVFLKHGFHDFLDLATARWENERIVVEAREVHLPSMIANTRRAAAAGIHVFWAANYELKEMLPHLQRLGYQTAFAEGPSRYLRPGEQQDAAPLDPTFWRGILGAHGELIARLSLEHPIDGLIYDTEHYAGGMMYLQNSGFSDRTFGNYAKSRNQSFDPEKVPAGTRYQFLKSSGRLPDYYLFLEEQAYEQGRELADRWHDINPHLIFGVWPLLDNWFSRGTLRGLGGAVPSLGLSGAEYYHGSEPSKSLADLFQSKSPNMFYLAGFYPPYSYSVDQLGEHVQSALHSTKGYWMLGPHVELAQPEYQTALRSAFEATVAPVADDRPPIQLEYRVEDSVDGPVLVVELSGSPAESVPKLSLYSSFGGAPLCRSQPMAYSNQRHVARIPLLRRLSNNQNLALGFRSGVEYCLRPQPNELFYEDPNHTKLVDGAAYGYFDTTVAWGPEQTSASAIFDLHRAFRIARVEVSQPSKLEDRIGGPSRLELLTSRIRDEWKLESPPTSAFSVTLKDATEPDTIESQQFDKRHDRAWLSWRFDLTNEPARWLRVDMHRIRNNSSISLGEVSIWGIFEGEVEAAIEASGESLRLDHGSRYTITVPRTE